MKIKILSVIFAAIMLFSTFSVNTLALQTPDKEELDDLFNSVGFADMMAGDSYFSCDSEYAEESNAPDGFVFEYMMSTPALQEYSQNADYYTSFTVPYDEYIHLVDEAFVNHSDMKNFLRENKWVDYNEETGIISWNQGGAGGPVTWVVTSASYFDDIIFVNGVQATFDFEPDGLTENKDYLVLNEDGEEYKVKIENDLMLTLKNVDGEWKILEYFSCGYHIVDDVLYANEESGNKSGIYNKMQMDAGNSTVYKYDSDENGAKYFYGNDSCWFISGEKLQYTVEPDAGFAVSYVTLTDNNGTRIIKSNGNVYSFNPEGAALMKVITREAGESAFEEFIFKVRDWFLILSFNFSKIFSIFG